MCIKRPPSSSNSTFQAEFTELLENSCLGGCPIVICGDLNIHWDCQSNSLTKKYSELLYSFGLDQHVKRSTHQCGHILDHIITRQSDNLSSSVPVVVNLVTDHRLVFFDIQAKTHTKPSTQSSYRRISKIDIANFKADIKDSNLYRNHMNMNLELLVSAYDADLRMLLDKHAPLVKRKSKTARSEPWQNDETHAALSTMRAAERKLNKSHDDYNRSRYFELRNDYRKLADHVSSAYHSNLIEQCTEQKQLYKTVHSIMHKDVDVDCPEHLANTFNDYFKSKIDNIRNVFSSNDDDPFEFDSIFEGAPLNAFKVFAKLLCIPLQSHVTVIPFNRPIEAMH